MTLSPQIYQALQSLAGGQVYPEQGPDDLEPPYVIWNEITTTPENTLGTSAAEHTRLQVDCFALTRLAADALADQVIAALSGAPLTALYLTKQRFTEDAVSLKRTVVDFSLWH